jgi:hypothetical protein
LVEIKRESANHVLVEVRAHWVVWRQLLAGHVGDVVLERFVPGGLSDTANEVADSLCLSTGWINCWRLACASCAVVLECIMFHWYEWYAVFEVFK